MKRLTGGDPLKARALHANLYLDAQPAFTPWVATNAMPKMHGVDKALRRRLRQVPFTVQVPEGAEDLRMPRLLASPEGRSAVLSWAVKGWELYREDGGLQEPESVVAATQRMFAELSEIDVFLTETFVFEDKAKVAFSELWDRFTTWCDDSNWDEGRKMSKTKLGIELNARGYEAGLARMRKGEAPSRVRIGLRLPSRRDGREP